MSKIIRYLNYEHEVKTEIYSCTDYNKLVADINTNPALIKSAYDYGLLQVVYIENIKQLEIFDEGIKRAYMKFKNISKADLIYMRIFSAFAETSTAGIIPKIDMIKFGITYGKLEYEAYRQTITGTNTIIQNIRDFIFRKKAIQLMNMQKELHNTEGEIWIYENKANRLIYSPAKNMNVEIKRIVDDWEKKLLCPEFKYEKCGIQQMCITEKSLQILCEICSKQVLSIHRCKNCMSEKREKIEDVVLPDKSEKSDSNDINNDETDEDKDDYVSHDEEGDKMETESEK